jgi:heat shock protein HslJ
MKKKGIILLLLVVTVLVMIPGCTNSSSIKLEDTGWILDVYGDRDNPKAVIDGTEITTTFSSDDRNVSGSAGCNNYFGSYEVGDGLAIGMLASTEMWCGEPEGRMDQETEYLKILQTAESYTIKDDVLTIDCGDNVLVFYSATETAN